MEEWHWHLAHGRFIQFTILARCRLFYTLFFLFLLFLSSLSDDRRVFVKISPYTIRLEREYYITQKLHAQPDGNRYIPQVLELVTLTQDGLCALVYSNDDDNEDNDDDNSKDNTPKNSQDDVKPPFIEENCPILDIKCFLTFAIECCSCLQFLHANSIVHGELRPSAFRWITPDKVKIWNFGAGLKSYEDRLLTVFGWRRAMMAAAAAADDEETIDETLLMEKVSGAVLSPSERTRRGLQSSLAYISPVKQMDFNPRGQSIYIIFAFCVGANRQNFIYTGSSNRSIFAGSCALCDLDRATALHRLSDGDYSGSIVARCSLSAQHQKRCASCYQPYYR